VSSCETLPASAGLPLAAGHQHSNQVTLDQGPIGPQDLLARRIDLRLRDLPALPARGRSLRAGTPPRYPKAAWVTPERTSRSGLRHGEDRLEGASQRPYPLSSSAAHPEQCNIAAAHRHSSDTSLYLCSPCTRVFEARVRGWVSRPVEGLSPPTNPWRSLAVASRERSFLPWVYVPLRGSPPMSRRRSRSPVIPIPPPVPSEPSSWIAPGSDMSAGSVSIRFTSSVRAVNRVRWPPWGF